MIKKMSSLDHILQIIMFFRSLDLNNDLKKHQFDIACENDEKWVFDNILKMFIFFSVFSN